jgi:HEPN domain-containing protein
MFPRDPARMTVPERKRDIILKLFVHPADEDYLASRWSYRMGLFLHFYWSAAQAVEKYFKASLLAAGQSSKGYSHDLERLFDDVLALDPNGIIQRAIALPDTTGKGKDAWESRDTRSFVRYLADYGDPDNRYGIMGRRVLGPDIHVLDALCLASRSLIRSLGIVPRCADLDLPWQLSCDCTLEQLWLGRRMATVHEGLADEFKSMNLAFFDAHEHTGSTFGGQHWSMSPLYVHLVKIAERDASSENLRAVSEVKAWIKASVQVTRNPQSPCGSEALPTQNG